MNRLLISVLFFLFFPIIALAQISASPGGISYIPGGSASSPSGGNINGGNSCAGYSTVTACALAIGYADPRLQYDSPAGSTYTSAKCNGSVDDQPGFNFASYLTKVPVIDPTNGSSSSGQGGSIRCQWSSSFIAQNNNVSIFHLPQKPVYNDTLDDSSLHIASNSISQQNQVITTITTTNGSPTATVGSTGACTSLNSNTPDLYDAGYNVPPNTKAVSCTGTTLTMSKNATGVDTGAALWAFYPLVSPYNAAFNLHGFVNANFDYMNFRGDQVGYTYSGQPVSGTVMFADDVNTSSQDLPFIGLNQTSVRQMGNVFGCSINVASGNCTGALGNNELEIRVTNSILNNDGYITNGNTPDLMINDSELSAACAVLVGADNAKIIGNRVEFANNGSACAGNEASPNSYTGGTFQFGTALAVGGAINLIANEQFQNNGDVAIELIGNNGANNGSTLITSNNFSQDAFNGTSGHTSEILLDTTSGYGNNNVTISSNNAQKTSSYPLYFLIDNDSIGDNLNITNNGLGSNAYTTAAVLWTHTPAHLKFQNNNGEPDYSVGYNFSYCRVTANSAFDLGACATGLIIPNFTTASRPSCTSTLYGEIYYDTTTNAPAMCQGSSPAWSAIGGGSSVSVTAGTPNIIITPSPGTGTFTVGVTNPINAQTTTTPYTIIAGDMGKTVTHSKATAVAVTLAQAGTTGFTSGASYTEQNFGVGIVTITPTTSTINGATTLVLNTNDSAYIYSDGTNWFAFLGKVPTEHISFQPGLLTTLNATKAAFHKFTKASTVDNIEGSANTFSCVSNPTITVFECGTSTTCGTPTTIGTVVVTTAGTVVDGTINSAAITAGDYVAFAQTAGTCASADLAATVQVHTN